jgi:hypothetical protein
MGKEIVVCVFYLPRTAGFAGSAKMPPPPTVARRGLASYQPQMLIANRGWGEGTLLVLLQEEALLWGATTAKRFRLSDFRKLRYQGETPKGGTQDVGIKEGGRVPTQRLARYLKIFFFTFSPNQIFSYNVGGRRISERKKQIFYF